MHFVASFAPLTVSWGLANGLVRPGNCWYGDNTHPTLTTIYIYACVCVCLVLTDSTHFFGSLWLCHSPPHLEIPWLHWNLLDANSYVSRPLRLSSPFQDAVLNHCETFCCAIATFGVSLAHLTAIAKTLSYLIILCPCSRLTPLPVPQLLGSETWYKSQRKYGPIPIPSSCRRSGYPTCHHAHVHVEDHQSP